MHNQGMAVRKDWPVVAGLLDKGLATMTAEERIRIDQKWGVIEFKQQVDYTLVWQVLAAALLILLGFLYRNLKLAAEVGRRRLAEQSAQEGATRLAADRDLLEQRVTERTKELTEALKFNESVLLN
jgi:C4-dicarboxylate-specific signal transduction histidine kinase